MLIKFLARTLQRTKSLILHLFLYCPDWKMSEKGLIYLIQIWGEICLTLHILSILNSRNLINMSLSLKIRKKMALFFTQSSTLLLFCMRNMYVILISYHISPVPASMKRWLNFSRKIQSRGLVYIKWAHTQFGPKEYFGIMPTLAQKYFGPKQLWPEDQIFNNTNLSLLLYAS